MFSVQGQFTIFFQFLSTPGGILAFAALILAIALSIAFKSSKWVWLSLAIFTSSFSFADTAVRRPMLWPLNHLTLEGRPLTMALLFLCLISLLSVHTLWRRRYLLPATIVFFAYELIIALRSMLGGGFLRGFFSIVIFALMFVVLALLLSRALQKWEDAFKLVKAFAGAGIIFAAINVVQIILKPSSVAVGGRFWGTTANPQQASLYCAITMLPLLYLIARPSKSRFTRLIYAGALALLLIMLLWTGSRTGLVMGVVGVAVLFRARLGKLAGTAIVVAILLGLAVNFLMPQVGGKFVSEHLFSTANTRSAVWHNLYDQFLSNPLIGSSTVTATESSYLLMAARLGIVGIFPFAIAAILAVVSLLRLNRVRSFLPDSMLADLIIAGLLQLAAGALFEGFLLGTLVVEVFAIYVYLALMAFVLEYAEVPQLTDDQVFDALEDQSAPQLVSPL